MNMRHSNKSLRRKLLAACPLCALARMVTGRKQFAPIGEIQLAFVIPLNDAGSNLATGLQLEILREYGRNPGLDAPPHITLKMGFGATDIAPFEKLLDQLASDVTPFEISIKNLDSFDEGILFLDVEFNPALESLRQRILADLSELHGISAESVEGPDFRFHVTLAHGFSEKEFARLLDSHASREILFKFTASHIDLFCHTGDHWVTYKRANLVDQTTKQENYAPTAP